MFSINEIKDLMAMGFTTEQIVAMSNEGFNKKASKPTRTTGLSKSEKWENRKAERSAEREEFFKTHKCISTADENRAKVYEAMGYVPKSGMYFDKALYKATAKKLGVIGKSGRVVGTYELIK
jgi:hypothetical protein